MSRFLWKCRKALCEYFTCLFEVIKIMLFFNYYFKCDHIIYVNQYPENLKYSLNNSNWYKQNISKENGLHIH